MEDKQSAEAGRGAGGGPAGVPPVAGTLDATLQRAAHAVANARALLVTAGAGMGVDSGLPDFRGDHGFWRAYPVYQGLGLRFTDLANPRWFDHDPSLAWGFYGHRLNLYRATRPHDGFAILQRWAARMPGGLFVYASNVDGQFQRAGVPAHRVYEVHGAIDRLQCTRQCGRGIFPALPGKLPVDPATMRAASPLPTCPACGALARPNILMFGDADWDETPASVQAAHLDAWFSDLPDVGALVVVECGAGVSIPTVRHFSESIATQAHCELVRINPRDTAVPVGGISIPLGTREALERIDALCTG